MEARSQLIRVAVAQAAPVFLDREGSTRKAIELIREAGRQGVDVLALPEGFVPAHPLWYHFHPATSASSLRFATELFKESVEVPGPEVDALCRACAEASVNAVIGVCERRPHSTGTMFNTQLFIDRAGTLLGKHRKLTPTVGERLVHTGGHGDGLQVHETDSGRVSGLICGENSNPLAIAALAAQGTQIHAASWPSHFSRNEHAMVDAVTFATRSLSYKASCFVLNACATVSDDMKRILPYVDDDKKFFENPERTGGSSIVGANSMVIAGPMDGGEEGILAADVDLDDCITAKIVHDYSGHYNRADVFSLTVKRDVPSLVVEREESSDSQSTPQVPDADTSSDEMDPRGDGAATVTSRPASAV